MRPTTYAAVDSIRRRMAGQFSMPPPFSSVSITWTTLRPMPSTTASANATMRPMTPVRWPFRSFLCPCELESEEEDEEEEEEEAEDDEEEEGTRRPCPPLIAATPC